MKDKKREKKCINYIYLLMEKFQNIFKVPYYLYNKQIILLPIYIYLKKPMYK